MYAIRNNILKIHRPPDVAIQSIFKKHNIITIPNIFNVMTKKDGAFMYYLHKSDTLYIYGEHSNGVEFITEHDRLTGKRIVTDIDTSCACFYNKHNWISADTDRLYVHMYAIHGNGV